MNKSYLGNLIKFKKVEDAFQTTDTKIIVKTGYIVGKSTKNPDNVKVISSDEVELVVNGQKKNYEASFEVVKLNDIIETISVAQLYDSSPYLGGFVDTHAESSIMSSGKLTNMVLSSANYILAFKCGFKRDGTFSFYQVANSISDLDIGGEVMLNLLDDNHPTHFSQHLPVTPNEQNEDACDNDWVYQDSDVYFEFTARVDGQATIHDIVTLNPEKRGARSGIGRATLQTLKAHFPLIVASGVGEDPDDPLMEFKPFLFWRAMLEEELVDGIVLTYDPVMITRDNLHERLAVIEADQRRTPPAF
jgi:hypothetical protein